MAQRKTKRIRYVRLSENRIREIENLVDAWPYETRSFMRARLNQYKPKTNAFITFLTRLLCRFQSVRQRSIRSLRDPENLNNWQKRFAISGQLNPQDAWNKILEKELSPKDHAYLLARLNRALDDIHVPHELKELFEKAYRAFIRKEYIRDPSLPKTPLFLLVGPTGSGKTATVDRTIEAVVFDDKVLPEIDLSIKKEALLSNEPFWTSIETVDPDLSAEINRCKRLRYYQRLSTIWLVNRLFKRKIARHLNELEEQSLTVDFAVVTPNDYQTALAGEPGNYFKRALGDRKRTTIRHIEEAHSAFGKTEGRQDGVERQQRSLVDTSNIVIDEIINGRRDCFLIATTDQPERIDNAIYRRFVEKGKIIDISSFWQNEENLKAVIRLELSRHDIHLASPSRCAGCAISPQDMEKTIESIYTIFKEKTLRITPAYVRKLIASIIEIKGGFRHAYLEAPLLVRRAFEMVAQNSYGDLYKKTVNRIDRGSIWEHYVGRIKDTFSEMANNCLYYGVNEEKGVVLNGPPGSGKTFLVRSWLSENSDIHDIATSYSALQDPGNPIEGAVNNLEKVYDIAKMIAPTLVFFDEGDSLAPKRSPGGGTPSDRLTNKFLGLIDGEIALNRVFTVLTTNRLDILDPALVRSKRLKILEVSGSLGKREIATIIGHHLEGVPLSPGVDTSRIVGSAEGICHTPADYSAFVEKVLSLRSTEYTVLERFKALSTSPNTVKLAYTKFNRKTLLRILETINAPRPIRLELQGGPEQFLPRFPEVSQLLSGIRSQADYPLNPSHLEAAKDEIAQNPLRKGKVQLDEFLEAELSQEPQVGFIIGVGANDVSGILLPIATSLIYRSTDQKIVVTGAVASSAPGGAELDMAVQMTQQSAKEALTLVDNYLQSLLPKMNVARVIGEFYDPYAIHHQLLSASYTAGGPSAGYALAINTLSTLLRIPVHNDFGITGAPWTKGIRKSEVGGSVIIGGHRLKTEKVLAHLGRMYLPRRNYHDLDPEFLADYWCKGKDVLEVTHFGDLVPEVLWLTSENQEKIDRLISLRIDAKLRRYRGEQTDGNAIDKIRRLKADLKRGTETAIASRLHTIRKHLTDDGSDPHLSLEAIFQSVASSTSPSYRLMRRDSF